MEPGHFLGSKSHTKLEDRGKKPLFAVSWYYWSLILWIWYLWSYPIMDALKKTPASLCNCTFQFNCGITLKIWNYYMGEPHIQSFSVPLKSMRLSSKSQVEISTAELLCCCLELLKEWGIGILPDQATEICCSLHRVSYSQSNKIALCSVNSAEIKVKGI